MSVLEALEEASKASSNGFNSSLECVKTPQFYQTSSQ